MIVVPAPDRACADEPARRGLGACCGLSCDPCKSRGRVHTVGESTSLELADPIPRAWAALS
jgi:hypothetical protein